MKISEIYTIKRCLLKVLNQRKISSTLSVNYMSQVMRKRVLCHMQITTSAQSDQHLCCSLPRQYDMYTNYIQSCKILACFCSWAGWFEPYLVGNPKDTFSHDVAHIMWQWSRKSVDFLFFPTSIIIALWDPDDNHQWLPPITVNFLNIRTPNIFVVITL